MEFDYSKIGQNIRQVRKAKSITQEKLSAMADISPQHLCRIENGNKKPSLEVVHRIADALGTSQEALFGVEKEAIIDYQKELETLFTDCNDYERNVIGEILVDIKKSIRRNFPLIKK